MPSIVGQVVHKMDLVHQGPFPISVITFESLNDRPIVLWPYIVNNVSKPDIDRHSSLPPLGFDPQQILQIPSKVEVACC